MKNTQVTKICKTCGYKFKVILCRKDKAKFCSKKCIRKTIRARKKISLANKGKPKSASFKRKMSIIMQSERNGMWKGDKAGLDAIHIWVHKRYPRTRLCENCGKVPPIDMANISQKYKRDISDWEWLCRRCHMVKDGRISNLKQYQ